MKWVRYSPHVQEKIRKGETGREHPPEKSKGRGMEANKAGVNSEKKKRAQVGNHTTNQRSVGVGGNPKKIERKSRYRSISRNTLVFEKRKGGSVQLTAKGKREWKMWPNKKRGG